MFCLLADINILLAQVDSGVTKVGVTHCGNWCVALYTSKKWWPF